MPGDILVVDHDRKELESLERDLISLGYHPIVAGELEHALKLLKTQHPALLLADIEAVADHGSALLTSACGTPPQIPVVISTGIAMVDKAVQCLKRGASFYLLKPVKPDQLAAALQQALSPRSAEDPRHLDREPHPQSTSGEIIVGASRAIQQVLDVAGRVASSNANIVLSGESGTGKELFARTIHSCSARAGMPFVAVDCASLPENLLEGELFGYDKGAFTGAIHAKPGLMELANRGTLFFDEVAELPLSLQPKLLRALQERQHRRLGGTRMVSFDVRVIAATNRNLRQLVSEGKFRQDLFYRLHVVPIHLPPLREREKDIILLANHLLAEHRRKRSSGPDSFAPEVLHLFEQYAWPGNVRELQNVVEYCCALARANTITVADLPEEFQLYDPRAVEITPSLPPQSFKLAKARSLAQFEAVYLTELLKQYGDNISQAARAAGVDRKTFYALLHKHHMRPAPGDTEHKERVRFDH